jgi:hypothetical protein
MGRITNKVTRYWSKKDIGFLKNNWRLNNIELARIMRRDMHGISDKRKVLGLPRRECDRVSLAVSQKMILYGSLLGDGSIVKGKEDRNYRFSEAHSSKQKEYLLFKHEKLKPFSGKFIEYYGKYGGEVKFSSKAHPIFKEIRKMFYGSDGKKIIKVTSLKKITHPLALAIWFGDDGNKEKDSYRIATGSYSKKEVGRLIRWLKDYFGIKSYLHKHGIYWYLSIREDRAKFTRLIAPFVHNNIRYKLF